MCNGLMEASKATGASEIAVRNEPSSQWFCQRKKNKMEISFRTCFAAGILCPLRFHKLPCALRLRNYPCWFMDYFLRERDTAVNSIAATDLKTHHQEQHKSSTRK